MLLRPDLEKIEIERLAPYAMLSSKSKGRHQKEEPHNLRMDFQRDRDRILHSSAFRKLEQKTQVFLPFESDYHRNRLTHTMEVAQIARTLCRNLSLNEDLTEAIALAHDLGHPPFGHAGEMALKKKMPDSGGFEHNEQGLRVVERLEERFAHRPGLNLTWEVREGISKHQTAYDHPSVKRFDPDLHPPLEAQVCDLADEIAYSHHDLDDALDFELIHEEELREIQWVWECWEQIRTVIGFKRGDKRDRYRLLGVLFDQAVSDVLRQTTSNIEEAGIGNLDDVRSAEKPLVTFSKEMDEKYDQLRVFLTQRVYRHPRVIRNATKAEMIISALFDLYLRVPEQLPLKFQSRLAAEGLERVICDYIAGMTDRYCQEEWCNSFEPQIFR